MAYNPSVLDFLYLRLTPQASLMTFRNAVRYTGSNAISNIWAKTADGWSQWTTFLTTTIVWDLLQTYSSILTNAINPIGSTLTIGNTAVDTNVAFATQNGRTAVLHLGDGPGSTGDIHIGNGLDSTNTIQILQSIGVPTGALPDGSPNLMLQFNLAANKGIVSNITEEGKLEIITAAGPGTGKLI
jgi:hypothetical protein